MFATTNVRKNEEQTVSGEPVRQQFCLRMVKELV